jgi:rhomboid protease GluP
LGGLIPHARFTTVMILLINTGLYLAMAVESARSGAGGGLDLDLQTLYRFGAKHGPPMEWWRLITAGFLHGGLMHILMNSWVLFDLGTQVEDSFGTSRYLVIYFFSTITGFLGSLYWSNALSVGASAGITGLIGAMIALGVRDRSAYGAAVRSFYTRWALYTLVFGLVATFFFPIDNAAHIGGLAGGFIVAYVAGTPGFSRPVERIWQIAAGLSIALTALAFAEMFLGLLGRSLGA